MTIWTIIAALLGAIVGFAAAGFGAASILVSTLGGRDGGPAMSGFFGFGPIGALAGALLAAGLVVRLGRKSLKWGRGLIVSGSILAACGAILLAVVSSPDRGPSYSHVIEFELEYPSATLAGIEIPSANAMWGAAGADSDDHPISQFFEKKCTRDVCILNGSIASLGPMNNFRVAASLGQKKYRYSLDLPPVVTRPVDWTPWRNADGARVRWRIVQR